VLLDSRGACNFVLSSLNSDIDVTPLPLFATTQRRANAPGGSSLWVMLGHSVREYLLVSEFLAFVLIAENQ
ncbi:glycerol-3-phosphate ABC transporter substrate-binding protein, partial [Pseudomonas syringae pv. tagetis]